MSQSYLKRDTSAAIKGIALICMFVHHFFNFPEWYVDGVSYSYLSGIIQYFYAPLKMCIPLFAFLTGYFYHFSSQKTLRYSLRKMADLLIPHWVVCLLISIPALLLGAWQFTVSGFLLEMMGLGNPIMMFSWYVAFYCASMLLLPLVDRLSSGRLAGDLLILVVLPAAAVLCVQVTIQEFGLNISLVSGILESIGEWFPCVVCGYLAARYSLFETYFDTVSQRFSSKAGKALLFLGMVAIAFFGRLALPRFCLGEIQPAGVWTNLVFTTDLLYTPMMVYGLAKLLEGCKIKPVHTVLCAIGKQSMYMWFLHAMFFNACKEFTQPLIYAPKNPLLVLLLALAVCYGLSVVIQKLVQPLLKIKNRWL